MKAYPRGATQIVRWLSATVLVAALALSAPQSAAYAEAPKVVVTIKPVHALVAHVMQGVAEPELLVKGQASPHTYALRPSESRALFTADAFFRISDSMEPFTTKVVGALPGTVTVISLLDTPDLHKLPRRQGTTFEHHSHGGHDHHADALDGHVWLDPGNARAMARHVEAVLSKRFPPYRATFKRNRETLDRKLAELDRDIATRLASLKGKPFAVYHDAFQYFEHRYGLNAVGSIFVSQDVTPGAKRLSDLRRQIAKLNAVCVFAEPNSDPRMINTIVEGSKVRAGVLDAEGVALEPGPELYFDLMRGIVKGLKDCLAPGA